jgi:hypothetical protein
MTLYCIFGVRFQLQTLVTQQMTIVNETWMELEEHALIM